MSRATVWSESPSGGDRFWLDNFGIIAGLVYETTYPGGDSVANWQITLDMRAQHRAWDYGRNIGICLGGSTIWHGHMDNPSRDTTWTMNAIGNAADGMRYVALAASSNNALKLNEVVDAAIVRGLGWTRPSSLPGLASTVAAVPSGSQSVAASLDQVAAGQTTETYWAVDTNGVLTMTAAPTTPSYILIATGVGGGRTLDGFVSDIYVMYQSASGVETTDVRSASSRPFGRFEQVDDQTALGLIPSSQADALGDAFLARNAARAKWTGQLTVTPGQLLTMGGVPVDLGTVRAGFLANIIVTDPDSAGEVALSTIPSVLMGGTSYDIDAEVLTLTPVYSAQDNLPALLGAGSAA